MISIVDIRSASPVEWDEIWNLCEYATYYHSRKWAEIWNIYTLGAMRPDPKLVTFEDGKKALLPISCETRNKGLVKNYISSPAGTYGGWISSDRLTLDHAVRLSNFLTNTLGNLYWRIN